MRVHGRMWNLVGIGCLLGVLLPAARSAAGPTTAEARPNVVIILADDLGWGDLGCTGHPSFKTPNLDRLAADGVRLTDFYSPCPFCAPSRGALQTGRYPFRNGLTRNPCPGTPTDDLGLPARERTLGELFAKAGYETICIGKWHLGHQPPFRPLLRGYQAYFGILYSNDMHPVELWNDDRMIEYPVYQATLTRRYTERAIAFIEANRDRPFLLYLPHAMPHKPLAASEEFYTRGDRPLYADVIAELDWSVGRIVEKLRERKLDGRTLLFFTSDNGPWYGGSTGGLRGMKGMSTEGGIRVPLIAWWPGRIPAGRVSREPAIMMDVFTTSLAAAGIGAPADRTVDGQNLLPLLAGDGPSPHEALFSSRGGPIDTVRAGRWKLHLQPAGQRRILKPDEKWIDPRRPDGVRIIAPCEQVHPSQYPGLTTGDPITGIALFDLQADPGEQHNVADRRPDIVQRLRAMAEKAEREKE